MADQPELEAIVLRLDVADRQTIRELAGTSNFAHCRQLANAVISLMSEFDKIGPVTQLRGMIVDTMDWPDVVLWDALQNLFGIIAITTSTSRPSIRGFFCWIAGFVTQELRRRHETQPLPGARPN